MTHVFGRAARDFVANSWRLVPLNAAVGAVLVLAGMSAFALRGAVLLVVLAGPLLAGLAHEAVTLRRTGNVVLADGIAGVRAYWRRGLALGVVGAVLLGLGLLAVHVYGGTPLWPLAFLTIYVLVVLGIYQLVLWTYAIAAPEAPLADCARDAAWFVARRPGATLGFGLLVVAVNVVGIAAGVMPFLTLTIAFSFLAAAHFVLEAD